MHHLKPSSSHHHHRHHHHLCRLGSQTWSFHKRFSSSLVVLWMCVDLVHFCCVEWSTPCAFTGTAKRESSHHICQCTKDTTSQSWFDPQFLLSYMFIPTTSLYLSFDYIIFYTLAIFKFTEKQVEIVCVSESSKVSGLDLVCW